MALPDHGLDPSMRSLARLLLLGCLVQPQAARAADDLRDCLDYEERYRAAMEVVRARSAGLETDQMRDKARNYLEGCVREERRLNATTTVCTYVNGNKVCRTE